MSLTGAAPPAAASTASTASSWPGISSSNDSPAAPGSPGSPGFPDSPDSAPVNVPMALSYLRDVSTGLEALNQIASLLPPTNPVALDIQDARQQLAQAVEGVYSNLSNLYRLTKYMYFKGRLNLTTIPQDLNTQALLLDSCAPYSSMSSHRGLL